MRAGYWIIRWYNRITIALKELEFWRWEAEKWFGSGDVDQRRHPMHTYGVEEKKQLPTWKRLQGKQCHWGSQISVRNLKKTFRKEIENEGCANDMLRIRQHRYRVRKRSDKGICFAQHRISITDPQADMTLIGLNVSYHCIAYLLFTMMSTSLK